jgi:hypothetical protein
VAEAAAVGVPDKIYGEEVVCYVVPKDKALTEAAVLEHCRKFLPPAKTPKQVLLVPSCRRATAARCCATSSGTIGSLVQDESLGPPAALALNQSSSWRACPAIHSSSCKARRGCPAQAGQTASVTRGMRKISSRFIPPPPPGRR